MGIIRGGDAEYEGGEPSIEEKMEKVESLIRRELAKDPETLKLSGQYFGGDEAAILSQSEQVGTVRFLDLSDNQIPDEGLVQLFCAANLSGVTKLHMGINFITDKGILEVAQTGDAKMLNLKGLILSDNKISDASAVPLVQSSDFQGLEFLDLGWNEIGNETAKALGQDGVLPCLKNIDLERSYIDVEGIRAWAEGSGGQGLLELNLSANKLNDEAVKILAQSGKLSSLKVLRLSQNIFGDEGARAIGESASLSCLTHLYMGRNAFGAEGAKAVYESQTLKSLETLMLKEGVETTPGLVNYSRPELLRPEDP